jgi:hypothetical protein
LAGTAAVVFTAADAGRGASGFFASAMMFPFPFSISAD